MGLAPPLQAEKAILAATSRIKRRCDIYEADGVTLWDSGSSTPRLISMAVTADYAREERRSLELTLDNSDGALRHNPDGFWYDKVLKVYQGVEYEDTTPVKTTTVRTNLCPNASVAINLSGWNGTGVSRIAQSGEWAASGVGLTMGNLIAPQGVGVVGKFYSGRVIVKGPAGRLVTVVMDTGVGRLTDDQTVLLTGSPQQVTMRATLAATATVVRIYVGAQAGWLAGEVLSVTKVLYENVSDVAILPGAFFDANLTNTPNIIFTWSGAANASSSVQTVTGLASSLVVRTWETQLGEFCIDRLDESNFPPIIKVSGRDYTKRCLLSKFVNSTSFTATQKIEDVIRAIATNAGIVKFLLPATGSLTGKVYLFEQGSDRWAAMKAIATAFSYDLYFSAQGFLVMAKYNDPILAPIVYSLRIGADSGNLVSYDKSTNDTRLFNHIIVTGESSDSTVVPVMAEAKNTLASSPSRIARIGDRVSITTNSFITTVAQAQSLANTFLQIGALEEYDINFSSISFPWLEVGQIIEFIDPDGGPTDPIRFLLSSLSFGGGLSPMSGNAKRVAIVV